MKGGALGDQPSTDRVVGPSGLRVGADARPITPDLSVHQVFLAGFQPDRPGTRIHDDLMVRTVAFAVDGAPPVVLSVCDLIGMPRVDERRSGAVVACTHTHHGPDTVGFWGRPFEGLSGIDDDYVALVRQQVAASQQAAVEALEPAVLRVGAVDVPELVANYRDPDILDPELTVWRATRADGSVIATLCLYGCHPEVVAPDNADVTADFAGHLCRQLEAADGGVAVFAAGALGGMQAPRTELRDHDESKRFGAVLTHAVQVALTGGVEVPAPSVSLDRREILVPLQNPMYAMAMAAGISTHAGVVHGPNGQPDAVVTDVSLIRVGAAALACVPGELLPKLGLRVKEIMRAAGVVHPAIVGLADDELGYILPAEDFTAPTDYLDPGSSYEESMSVGPDLGPAVCAALEELVAAT
jgi:hypothetical protein